MARPSKRRKLNIAIPKNANDQFEQLFNQSIKRLKRNEKEIEDAISQLLSHDEIKVSEAEYNELKRLTDTLDEIDSVLEDL